MLSSTESTMQKPNPTMPNTHVNTISDDLMVEVYGSNNAWFKAWVIDVFKSNALCTFENGWKPDTRIPFLRIRKLPDYSINYNYTLNEEVEVKSNTNPSCWWPATINLISGDRNTFSIVYSPTNNSQSNYAGDLVGRDRIRPLTQSKFIHEAMFFKYAVDVPDKMRECADIPGVLDEAAFSHFKEDTGASLIRYDKDTNQIVVLTPHHECYKDVSACFEYQLSLLEKKVDQLLRKKRYADRLQDTPASEENTDDKFNYRSQLSQNTSSASTTNPQTQYREEFKIHPNFMGLAIGARGKNINECRRIPGIIALDLEEEACHFKIVGETKEAVQQARNKLEYSELIIEVERDIASRIIGRKGQTIQKIVDESGCVRVRLDNPLNPDGTESQITRFIFTGTQLALKHSKILTNCQVQHAKDTVALAEQNLHADSMLRSKLYCNPSPRTAPLLTPRAPITPPYPSDNPADKKGVTPLVPDCTSTPAAMLTRQATIDHNQTPTLPPMDMPRIERLTIETQTEPLEVEFVKPAPPPPAKHEAHIKQVQLQEESKIPSPRQPLQRRPQYQRENVRDNAPRETYRTHVRDPAGRRVRESPRPVPSRDHRASLPSKSTPLLNKPAGTKPLSKPVLQKPRVDIKLANEKIGSALAGDKTKAEEVRTEQQAAIEDLIKAEQISTVDKPVTFQDEDKENNRNVQPTTINNQNVKVDNQKKENENITKVVENAGEQILQTMVNEALVCEFSPAN
ncbi:fragile X messenger ribonucleoprotein 1 homolog B-like isoform X3 [Bolinopsis microptera]|uniref:fragile X messenger ribonucleoprotein 1 homolog B-like isoform X3 n=1 Tax=Bolinopsis microptera TaxID=2820187 RepID=UPI00307A3374